MTPHEVDIPGAPGSGVPSRWQHRPEEGCAA